MISMYERMLQLPIFQGLSEQQLTEIIEKIPFSFMRFNEGDVISQAGDVASHVTFILSGKVRYVTPAFGGEALIQQDFEGPHTMPFYYMFGAETRNGSTLTALEPVGVMQLDKGGFLTLMQFSPIIVVNVMNILSTHAQRQHRALDITAEPDKTMRLAQWLLAYTDHRSTDIVINAPIRTWCQMLQLSAQDFWDSFSCIEKHGCIELFGKKLRLKDRYGLRGLVNNSNDNDNNNHSTNNSNQ